jgi:hypothetical protein
MSIASPLSLAQTVGPYQQEVCPSAGGACLRKCAGIRAVERARGMLA